MNIVKELYQLAEGCTKEEIIKSLELEPGIVMDQIEEFPIDAEKKKDLLQAVANY